MQMKLSTRTVDGILVVDCTGRIIFGEDSASLRDTLRDLIPESEYQAELFADEGNRAGLSATMDKLNLKYGHTTLHFAGMLPARESAPTRIAFTQIPVQYGVDYM